MAALVVHGLEEAVEKLETEGIGETQAAEAMYADPVGDEERGVLLLGVTPDSPAAEIGLRRGDIILAVDGEEVDSPSELHTAIRAQVGRGQTVTLLVLRCEEPEEMVVHLGRGCRWGECLPGRLAPASDANRHLCVSAGPGRV